MDLLWKPMLRVAVAAKRIPLSSLAAVAVVQQRQRKLDVSGSLRAAIRSIVSSQMGRSATKTVQVQVIGGVVRLQDVKCT